jgi:hypothetical protein
MKSSDLATAIGLAMTALSGCGGGGYGGGGGGGGGYMNLSSAPGAAALTAYVQANHSGTLHATDTMGGSWTLQYSATANTTTTTFNGTPNAYSTTNTVTLTRNGAQIATNTSTSYYLLNPFMPLGAVTSTGTPYAVVATFSPLPATVMVGNSGSYDTLTFYHDSTKAVTDATETDTYSVAANNSTTLLVCIDSTIAGVTKQGTIDGLAAGTETDCYTVDASGNAALFTITVTVSAGMLKFQ